MNQSAAIRLPYRGSETNLVISIDLGTTFSATSWVLLDPDQVPQIWDVAGFEGQEHIASAKVPTVLYYDSEGELKAVGGETLDPQIISKASEQKWTRVEWFKLLLRPNHLAHIVDKAPKAEMPRNKKLVAVISDFLRYMANIAQSHFHEMMDDEGTIWEEVKDRVLYVLSHPNGWNTFQHSDMREAATLAGLVPESDEGKNRIIFVSEGEASLHWCMSKGIGRRDLKVGSHFVVVDAGGGTIDVSSFKTVQTLPLEFEESSAPECHLEGSVFVTQAFKRFVEAKLNSGNGSIYGDPENIERLVDKFDKKAKCNFRHSGQDMLVKFGARRESDPNFDITAGQLLVRGTEMVPFYEPACRAIVRAVTASVKGNGIPNGKTTVVLVGGFSGNSYLLKELQTRLSAPRFHVIRGNDSAAKAAANGAICFYLDRSVSARMAKWTYGVSCVYPFNSSDPKHKERRTRIKSNSITGEEFLDEGFFVTLEKDTAVQETKLIPFPFYYTQLERSIATLELVLECYRGNVHDIKFRDEDREEQFRELCRFKADIPEASLVRTPKKKTSWWPRATQYYYVSNFHIVVSFGATEFKCYIEWKDEKGETQRGPITPIWDEG